MEFNGHFQCNNFNVYITRLNLREVESEVTEISALLILAALYNSFSPIQNEFSQINHALSEAIEYSTHNASHKMIFFSILQNFIFFSLAVNFA